MRLALIAVFAACTDPSDPDTGPLLGPAACAEYMDLYSAAPYTGHEPNFIAPIVGIVWVDGDDFRATEGASVPQSDGTTLVYRALEYRFADGTAEQGSVGRRGDSELCEWAAAVRYEP